MTRELLGRVSKASQELFGQNADLIKSSLLGREEPVPKSSRVRCR
jgi:hypothetical protein